MPPQRPLDVVVVADDSSFRESLVRALEGDDSIGTVRVVVPGRQTSEHDLPDGDVLLFDAGPPAPNLAAVADWQAKNSLAIVLASDMSEQTCELAEAVGAAGYLRKDAGVAEIAPVVAAFAALSSRQLTF